MVSQITIRKALETDLESIAALIEQLGYPSSQAEMKA